MRTERVVGINFVSAVYFSYKANKNENNTSLIKGYSEFPRTSVPNVPGPKLPVLLPLHLSPLPVHQCQSLGSSVSCCSDQVYYSVFVYTDAFLLFMFRFSYFVTSELFYFCGQIRNYKT
jgi:hypothetical protein